MSVDNDVECIEIDVNIPDSDNVAHDDDLDNNIDFTSAGVTTTFMSAPLRG